MLMFKVGKVSPGHLCLEDLIRFTPSLQCIYINMYSLHYCIFRNAFSCFSSKFVTLLTNLTNEQAQKQMKTKLLVEFKPNFYCVNSCVFTIFKIYCLNFNYMAKHFL